MSAEPTKAITGPITGEGGRVWSGDPESLECVCGNHANFDGLVSYAAEGIALGLHPCDLPKPGGLAAWPEDADEVHRLCLVCGRLYRDRRILDTNTAPGVQLVDLADGSPTRQALDD